LETYKITKTAAAEVESVFPVIWRWRRLSTCILWPERC